MRGAGPRVDRHADLGPLVLARTWDSAVELVRGAWPGAWQEGSTGPERSWWWRPWREHRPQLVAHTWPRGRGGEHWVRLAPSGGRVAAAERRECLKVLELEEGRLGRADGTGGAAGSALAEAIRKIRERGEP